MEAIQIFPAGDRALVAVLGAAIDPEINDRVHSLLKKVQQAAISGIKEMVPTFCSLMIHYDPDQISYGALKEKISQLAVNLTGTSAKERHIWQIPCCYGSHFGPDLADLEKHSGLTRDEIISIHSNTEYKIYMLGFLPGFVYLGGLDVQLHMPRLSTPRIKIPQGAVGIGGSQTGVYPLDSPGGWRLIGSTPVDFYDPDREEPVLCRAGDYIRFVPITSSDYYDIRQMQRKGDYTPLVINAE